MKKIASLSAIIMIAFVTVSSVMAQSKQNIEAFRTSYIKEKLNLTDAESKKFWPVYNAYQKELNELRRSQKINTLNLRKSMDEVSESELEEMIDGEIAFKQQEVDLQRKYHNKFKQVLPAPKVAALYLAEEGFKRELLKRIKSKD